MNFVARDCTNSSTEHEKRCSQSLTLVKTNLNKNEKSFLSVQMRRSVISKGGVFSTFLLVKSEAKTGQKLQRGQLIPQRLNRASHYTYPFTTALNATPSMAYMGSDTSGEFAGSGMAISWELHSRAVATLCGPPFDVMLYE